MKKTLNKPNKMMMTVVLAMGLLASGMAVAGDCEIGYTRTACPGQEAVSYKKCNGKQSCTETEDAADVAECKKMAIEACANSRFTITKSKVVNAKFDGKAIATDAGNADFCTAYAKVKEEFNQCNK